jgi:hypothetical protein
MQSETEVYAASELEQVAHCFDHWRHTRAHRNTPIPQPLWHQAVTLTTRLPFVQVAKRLGVKSTTLKQHCTLHQVGLPHEATASAESRWGFVEVPSPPDWPLGTPATEIDLQRADGARLRIHCREPQVPLAALIRTFLETS